MSVFRPSELTEPGKRFAAKIKRLARADDVEVEHLLGAVLVNDPGLIPFIEGIAAKHEWAFRGRIPGSRDRWVPLGRWAFYVTEYLRGGAERMVELALDPEERLLDEEDGLKHGGFPLGVLEFKKAYESVDCVLRIGDAVREGLESNRDLALGCASALSLLTACKKPVALSESDRALARPFLHDLLRLELSEPDAARVYGALRTVGNDESIRLIASRPPITGGPWLGMDKRVTQAIQHRMKQDEADG